MHLIPAFTSASTKHVWGVDAPKDIQVIHGGYHSLGNALSVFSGPSCSDCEEGLFDDGNFGCSKCPPTWMLYVIMAAAAVAFTGYLLYGLTRTNSSGSDLSAASKIIFSGTLVLFCLATAFKVS